MNKDRNTYLVIGLVFIALIALFFSIEASLTQWDYHLDIKKKNAYGLFLTHQLVKTKYAPAGFEVNTDKSIKDLLSRKNDGKDYTYLFIGAIPYLDSVSVDTLLDIVHKGSTVFLAADNLNERFNHDVLQNRFHTQVESYYSFGIGILDNFFQAGTKPAAYFNFTHPGLKDRKDYYFLQKYKTDTVRRYFLNFEPVSDSVDVLPYDTANSVIYSGYQSDSLGQETGQNFALFGYGKGRFVILLSALPFTNYYLRDRRGLEYLEKIFAHIPAEQPVIWDEYAKAYRPDDGEQFQGSSAFGDSPLYFILQHKSLRIAWYLLLSALLIYTVFAAKRRQKIIPLIEPKANTSLQYVETIGQLYYDETEHLEIANEMRTQFFNFLRKKYYLPVHQLDEENIPFVAAKTGVYSGLLEKLAGYFDEIRKVQSFDASKLDHFNTTLEQFYSQCK